MEITDEKRRSQGFTQAQKDLLAACGITEIGHYPRPLGKDSFVLVLETERGMEFDALKAKLNPRLDEFKKKLDGFVKKYL